VADIRKTSLLVGGQEVLTADNVGLKLSVLVAYQVADPAKAAHDTQNWRGDLYNTGQLALRAVVGGVAIEALLALAKPSIDNASPEVDSTGGPPFREVCSVATQ